MQENKEAKNKGSKGLLRWLCCVSGWLVCAAMCLWLTIALEAWPYAYDMFFPAILLILFCNILVFLFIASRWGGQNAPLFSATLRVCIGEALLLGGIYALGRYAIGY